MPRILVIDDDSGIRTAIELVLELDDHDITLAESGRAALRLLEGQFYDVALVDILMPDMNGVETVKVLRALRPQMPIIVMSGLTVRATSVSPDLVKVAMKFGANRSMRKPFGSEELLLSVRSCLNNLGRRV